jgi:hypothetical protein
MSRSSDAYAPRAQASLAGVGWSPERAADVIGVTPDHVRHLCRSGQLIAMRERRRWFLDPGSVRSYVARRARIHSAREVGDGS